MLLSDVADLQRFISDRHGAACLTRRRSTRWRASTSFSRGDGARDTLPLLIPASLRVDEAVGVVNRYLEQGAATSRHALERELQRGSIDAARRSALLAGAPSRLLLTCLRLPSAR
jgi:hypothetical protein